MKRLQQTKQLPTEKSEMIKIIEMAISGELRWCKMCEGGDTIHTQTMYDPDSDSSPMLWTCSECGESSEFV